MGNTITTLVLIVVLVFIFAMACAPPPPTVTNAQNIGPSYIDCKYGVVCWGSFTYYSAGMGCLPIKDTRISYEDVCPEAP